MKLYPAASIASRRIPLTQLLAGYVIAAYDAAETADVIITGSGVSQHTDPIGARNLLQGTDNLRPIYTAAGSQSYYTGTASAPFRALKSDAGTSLSGGDLCFISVVKFNTLTTNRIWFSSGDGANVRTAFRTHTSGTNFAAYVSDSVGFDLSMIGPTWDANRHVHIMRNQVGVVRKYHVDGGAGYAGARTTAMATSQTLIGLLASDASSNAAHADAFYHAICKPCPPAAVLNTFGAAAAVRFGLTWNDVS